MPMKNTIVFSLLFLILATGTVAGEREIGVEVQAYPTGVVAAVDAKVPLKKDGRFLTFRVGYNDVDRDDNGERDDEKGGGPGISAGWQRMFSAENRGWFAGVRADLWFLEIDWIDQPGMPGQTSGTTDVIVLQPTGRIGYRLPFGEERNWSFEPAASLGVEWNIDTSGADVGQGAILLLGFGISRRF